MQRERYNTQYHGVVLFWSIALCLTSRSGCSWRVYDFINADLCTSDRLANQIGNLRYCEMFEHAKL